MRRLLLLLCLLVASPAAFGQKAAPADTILTHARIYTVNARQPWAEAVAIREGRIVAVGSARQVLRHRGPATRVLDAGGRLVLPGFVDSHIHFLEGSLALTHLSLDDTHNVEEIQKAVQEFAAAHPGTGWLIGRGWSYPEFPGGMPHKKYLDAIVPDRPVYLGGFDGHTSWVNSAALKLAGITRDTPDPPNGKIVRDADGEPTGALQEAAADLVVKLLPQPTREEKLAALRAGIAEANRVGLTRVISCGNDTPGGSDHNNMDLLDELRRQGQLTLRFYASTYANPAAPAEQTVEEAIKLREKYPQNDEWLAAGATKFFLDGVIEGHTAAMLAPYSDDPLQSGSLRWDPARYESLVAELDRAGIQIFTHAIGDRAVRLALDSYEHARQVNHTADARPRVEHIETVSAADIPRFGRLGVIASFQPLHAYPDDDTLQVWLKGVGEERKHRAWAWRSIAASGGRLAFGSDWPVVTLSPWPGVQNAVTRQTREGKPEGGWIPEERVTVAQAVEAYTLGAAIGGRREKTEGSIEPGKAADLIVVSQDIFRVDPHSIAATEVLMTMVGGKMVYESPAWRVASQR